MISRASLCALIVIVCISCAAAGSTHTEALLANKNPAQVMVGNFYYFSPCGGVDPCTYFYGPGDNRASGSGSFSANGFGSSLVEYSFVTGFPLTWGTGGDSYYATFGLGGSFEMSLPNGLVFTGLVTSGVAGTEGFMSMLQVTYAGEWSNGQYATGSVYEYELGYGPYQSIEEEISPGNQNGAAGRSTPEPSSFPLLEPSLRERVGLEENPLKCENVVDDRLANFFAAERPRPRYEQFAIRTEANNYHLLCVSRSL